MRRFRDLLNLTGREREGLVQAAKMAVAAVGAWLVAREFYEPQSFIAPYAAVFMIGGTVFRSLKDAALQVFTVTLGVVLAFGVVMLVPYGPAALGVAVFVGMVIGAWHRLGSSGIWVGVVALLMIAYGTADDPSYLVSRVGESVLGAVIGVVVNVLVFPPMRLREGDQAVETAAGEIVDLLRRIASGLREEGWDLDGAREWHRESVALDRAVREADDAIGRGRESTWYNPRVLLRGRRPEPGNAVLNTLYDIAEQARHLTKVLVASADPDDTAPLTGPAFDRPFADVLDELATEIDRIRENPSDCDVDHDALRETLRRVRELRSALARQAPWPDHLPPEDWSAHAALVLAAERIVLALLNT
ncbi:FUSC family protein [Actinophytocola gossypii]|uniref:FUSC family protein n=1 Tax=Actinophytocola gossypii TaxID=2812003 RepID=A0ABT2JCI8_9PSEU|nr:aromatic acid exporter family protein [Actinophytocola gossypii]MCT2585468.1 FUSC family protein [Actinophytocola gossypii]